MKGPNDDSLSRDEERLAKRLEEEVEEHLRGGAKVPYTFEPDSTGAYEFNERVKREVIRRARKAGYKATDLDSAGGFTVTKP